jgi:mannose-6-phosphate isomerase-like protein (cupin superfamily)
MAVYSPGRRVTEIEVPVAQLLSRVLIVLIFGSTLRPATSAGQEALVIRPLAELRVTDLPPGELFWRIERYPSREDAQAAAGPWSLVAEAASQVWLFTLGSASDLSAKGTKVSVVGPIRRITASQYLLRVNEASGPPGSVTPVHSHPGSEAFFVLAGEQSIRGPHGIMVVRAGEPEAGHGAGVAMQVSNSGPADLEALVMFVVDANKPFSSPASFQ